MDAVRSAGDSGMSETVATLYMDFLRYDPPEYFEASHSDPAWKKSLFSMANGGLDDERKRIAYMTAHVLAKFGVKVC